ncbi:MAG: amidohydrolase [Thermoleophilia bacterium]|nr:amidohydrolase [Thermoleophilia bacterium]
MIDVIDARALPPLPGSDVMGSWADLADTVANRQRRGIDAPLDSSLETYRADCVAAGVRHAVVTGRVPNSAWGYMPNESAIAATSNDDFYLAATALDADDSDVECTIATLVSAGARAMVVEPALLDEPRRLDDAENHAVFDACSRSGLPVYVMCGGEVGPDLSWSDPLALESVAAAFPDLRIVCMHAGWPFTQVMLGVCYRRSNIWLMPDVYFPGLPGEADIVAAMNTYLVERVLFASAYPYSPVAELVERWSSLPLKSGVLGRVLHDNAAELLSIN